MIKTQESTGIEAGALWPATDLDLDLHLASMKRESVAKEGVEDVRRTGGTSVSRVSRGDIAFIFGGFPV